MNHYPSNVKEKLNSIILSMAEHHWLFSKNPGHDFTRQHLGKLSFYDTMRLIISMGKGSTNDEIMDYFNLNYLTLSLHSLLSASAADRFPSLLLNTFFGILFFFSIHYGQIQRPLYSRLRWVPRCLCYQF